jgi:hypothetical protein
MVLPLMAIFIMGLFDYMTTNARAMEAIAIADLAPHAGAQEVFLLPNGKILSDVPKAKATAYSYFMMQAPSYVQLNGIECGDVDDLPYCRVSASVATPGYLMSRTVTVDAIAYLAWGVTREKH